MKKYHFLLLLIILAACVAAQPVSTVTTLPVADVTKPCTPEPVIVPTAAPLPGYAQLDSTTGLHFTGSTVPEIDLDSWRLEIVGKIGNPLSLSYDDLRCMPRVELRCTLICPGFFQDEATWAGVPLDYVLELAQVGDNVQGLKLYSADGYSTTVPVEVLRNKNNFLAYEWEGEPLPIIHGFPLRAVFPEETGNFWAKWLIKIEVY